VPELLELTCPSCATVLEVSNQQMNLAEGRVRCGSCLQVFSARSGDIDFTPPQLSEGSNHPLAGISVHAMSHADLPETTERRAGLAAYTAIVLLLLLVGQLVFNQGRTSSSAALEIRDLSVRPHPQYSDALQLNVVLSNRSNTAQAYPSLLVHFSNRYGERLNQGLFPPISYLKGEATGSTGFPPNTRLQLSLDLADPGTDAINYGLQLHSVNQLQN
jgi:predicted Zn finger-like uncharacterized protein